MSENFTVESIKAEVEDYPDTVVIFEPTEAIIDRFKFLLDIIERAAMVNEKHAQMLAR